MAKTEAELKEGFEMKLAEDGTTIILVFFRNEEDPEDNISATYLVTQEAEHIFEKDRGKVYNAIVDFIAVDDAAKLVAPESRKVYIELMSHPQLGRIAFIGNNSFVASLIESMALMTNKHDKIRWFTDVEEAKTWLSSES